jgi:hypothetical protein
VNEQRIEIAFVTPLQVMEVAEPQQGGSILTIKYLGFTITVEGDHVMYTLPVDKQVEMQVTYVDAEGNAAEVDGEVIWASSDDDIATVKVSASDSTIVTVVPVGAVGQCQITATADADLGQGVRNLITVCDLEIVAGEAVAGSIQPLGEPVDKP